MIYRKKDIFISLFLSIFIISFAVCFTVFFTPFYDWCISLLGIDKMTYLSIEDIKLNYQCMINYFSLLNRNSLEFIHFNMSNSGSIHFEDVKVIVDAIQVICITSGVVSSWMIFNEIKKQEYRYFNLTFKLVLFIPLALFFVCMINFDLAFILFHKLLFRNEYWVFSIVSDPVITILPQDFFMLSFGLIIFIILMSSVICYLIYKNKVNNIIKSL